MHVSLPRKLELLACQALSSLVFFAALSLARAGMPNDAPFVDRYERLEDPSVAEWVAPPEGERATQGVYLFRQTFEISSLPSRWEVFVTADPRFKLYVNGTFVTFGPSAGDPFQWHYDQLDLAPWLKEGTNCLAIEVWDPGPYSPARHYSVQPAVLVQTTADSLPQLRSDNTWKVLRTRGWSPLPMDDATVGGGYIAGATDSLKAADHPLGWTEPSFDASAWPTAKPVGKASHGGLDTWLGTPWVLRPRGTPLVTSEIVHAGTPRQFFSGGKPTNVDPRSPWPFTVPAHSEARLLLDAGTILFGFPRVKLSGGAGATVQMRYQESLFQTDGRKGHRDEIEGKIMKGYFDRILLDGRTLTFEPQWVRTYRYLELTITAAGEPVEIDSLEMRRVRYPFVRKGSFESPDASLTEIQEASWRTVELCALEHYMDCPYYEQLQYLGDTRIQALISLYMTGDARLMRQALEQFDRSRLAMGLTQSSFPIRGGGAPQVIPPFSLLYVMMVHDYHLHRPDGDFIARLLPGIRFTLEWFLQRLDDEGLMGPLPFWNHTDGGAQGFHHGSPPGASSGKSIQLTLLLAAALDDAAVLARDFGRASDAAEYREKAAALKAAVNRVGFDAARGLYAETPEKKQFSQHTNAFAILTNTVHQDQRAALAERLVNDRSMIQASLYFQHYVFEALAAAGRGDLVLGEMDRWKAMLAAGLTTFPEHGIESRSDAHAWAANPLYHLLASVAGVRPAEPGFKSVRITPAPGSLPEFAATVCHPRGVIRVGWKADPARPGSGRFTVSLPEDVPGVLVWRDEETVLVPGENQVEVVTVR